MGADIFISYAREDQSAARVLAESLVAHGWSVWWDRDIPPGRTWDEVIEVELANARVVIVLWSGNSVASKWVRAEANEAMRRGVLIPVRLEEVIPPLAFRQIQAAELAGWVGDQADGKFKRLVNAVRMLAGEPSSKPLLCQSPSGQEDLPSTAHPKPSPHEKRKEMSPHEVLRLVGIEKNGLGILDSILDYTSVADFTQVIEQNPKLPEAYVYRALVHSRNGEHGQAVDDLTRAIGLNHPRGPVWIHYVRAQARFHAGDREGARDDVERATRSDDGSCWYLRASTLQDMGQLADALSAYDDAINYEREHGADTEDLVMLYEQRAELRVQRRDYKGAIVDYTQIIELEHEYLHPDPEWYRKRGRLRKMVGDNEGAISDTQRAQELDTERVK